MKKYLGFTLAEVLITLAIIGVVAAIAVPSVVSNSQQTEYKTGLRKAVSVLNSAITMNLALEGETPYDNANLFGFFMRHMSMMSSFSDLKEKFYINSEGTGSSETGGGAYNNTGFYTTDGMRYEFRFGATQENFKLHEDPTILACSTGQSGEYDNGTSCEKCGSYGLNSNADGTTYPPCVIAVDVNGDRKPNPQNADCKSSSCSYDNYYRYSDVEGLRLTDIFSIMITDKAAIPYGIAAQRAMYSAQSN